MKRCFVMFLVLMGSNTYARSITITSPITETIVPGTSSTVIVAGTVDSVTGGAGVVTCNGKTASFLSGTNWRRGLSIPQSGPIDIVCIYSKDGIVADDQIKIYHDQAQSNSRPVADFTYVATNSQIAFDGSSSTDLDGQIVDWQWDFGDGQVDAGSQVTHTFNIPGVYKVYLRVKDNSGNVRGTDLPPFFTPA